MKFFLALSLTIMTLTSFASEEAHNQIRAFRSEMISAFNARDIDKIQSLLHPEVTVSWLNGEVSKGPQQVRAYYEKMMVGPNKIVDSMEINPVPTDLSILYGDSTIATSYGVSDDTYKLTSGMDFKIKSNWSATLARVDGKWLLSSYHASVNMFDNPLLNKAQSTIYVSGIVGLILGLILASALFVFKRKAQR